MKIVFLKLGGFSGVNDCLIRTFRKKHWVVVVDCHKALGPWRINPIFRMNSFVNFFYCLFRYGTKWRFYYNKNPFAFKRMSEYCQNQLKKIGDYDLVFQTQTLFAVKSNKPYFVYTDYPSELLEKNGDYFKLESLLFNNTDAILTYNDYMKDFIAKTYDCRKNKIYSVGVGVNVENIPDLVKGNEPIILAVSYNFFSDKYGGKAILQMFNQLLARHPDFKLFIVGEKLKLSNVNSCGRLSYDELEKIYKKATIFVNPGNLGGVQATLEAMAHKCVCLIGNNNPLLKGLVEDNKTVILVKPNDSLDLFDKLLKLFDNKELLNKIRDNAYKEIKTNLNWDQVVSNIEKVYKKK